MKSILTIALIFLGVFLLAPPAVSFAAYNDVTLQAGGDTELSVGGVTILVSAPNAVVEQISVAGSSFTLTMPGNSYFKITSADRRQITTTDYAPVTLQSTCTSALATYLFESPSSATSIVFTVTVSGSTCTTGGTVGGSGGGGGGGGGGSSGYVYIPPKAEPATPAVAAVPKVSSAVPATPATPALPALTKILAKGSTGTDVLVLQKILNKDADTLISASGAGSPGNETTLLGPATVRAIQKFQVKYGLAKPGDAGYGQVGPKTRAKLNEIGAGASVASTATVTATPAGGGTVSAVGAGSLSKTLVKGTTNAEVKILQRILNSDPETAVAASGSGSAGMESNYFGPGTLRALKNFQEKYGLSGPGEQGYGTVGPKTRAKLNELSGGASATSAPNDAAQKQIDDAMKQIKLLQEQLKTAQ